jgi:hypothetical protein
MSINSKENPEKVALRSSELLFPVIQRAPNTFSLTSGIFFKTG